MKEYRAYIIILSSVLLVYAVYDYYKPDEANWIATYKVEDKDPFGTFILNERSKDLFDEPFATSFQTLSELDSGNSILLIADKIEMEGADFTHLFELLEEGTNIFIASNRYNQRFMDTLKISSVTNFDLIDSGVLFEQETKLTIGTESYGYPSALVSDYFELDSVTSWSVLGFVEAGPVAISQNFGQGKLVLVSSPRVFTNFGMLFNENHGAAANLLSSLPRGQVRYSMFYHSGRSEASTPLRYFLSQPPLKWAVYLGLFIVIVFLMVDSWRKQRSIKIINPPVNASVEYVKTLGALFYREGNHNRTAQKLIDHFFSEIRERFLLEPDFTEKFYAQYSGKSGIKLSDVISTFELIATVRKTPLIEEKTLVELSNKIDAFK